MARMKTEVPVLDGAGSASEKVEMLREYLVQHRLELDFVLSNLSGINFNGAGFAMDILDEGGKARMGTLGRTEKGVGFFCGEARVEVTPESAALWFGNSGIRATASGVEYSNDGETWKLLET